MSGFDPMMFAAKAANMPEAELRAEMRRFKTKTYQPDWRQAVEDELALRHLGQVGQA